MVKRTSDNEKYWRMKSIEQLRADYALFLSSEDKENTPHNAHIFAIQKLSGSREYMGLSEREIIITLAGSLPDMYD
jgi:hypothetical protein